ncbi:MAG: Nitroreductase family protein [Candidatus Methanofastidiosum methylothiophilum]|uniref:Nitroreductase family protein n=1 Tax=Candidatus Methanofastidiosum methylothiophilum TaxID=1705564 RepID=A0A150IZU5_9EURY|nr:MAG: Nitroreductase family protein [Candidatus Methanofastidiosum methylthiophilus]KYC47518.1 MAG: Nitroreductase family protein [Candidatus Methanofastidiosum methylthiophilus]KYC50418.1 MAG: Nitroreductase family protein [Candidatus Methanofastidiosum methylthiophilus]
MLDKIDWESAINVRRSVRSYEMREVDKDSMDKLRDFINNMKAPFAHDTKIRFFKANSDKKLYSTFNSPPDGMAFISNTNIESISKVGFIGEMIILYATSLGLSTCWYGHYSIEELERIMPHLGNNKNFDSPKWGYGKGVVEGERAICISPLGYWKKEGLRLTDRVTGSLMSYKRKDINELLEGITKESLTPELLYALDLARKAPSGANSQHWRFKISSDLKTVSIAMPVGYKHIKWEHPDVDIGICACHFWLGLMMKNIECKVSLIEEKGRAVWKFQI